MLYSLNQRLVFLSQQLVFLGKSIIFCKKTIVFGNEPVVFLSKSTVFGNNSIIFWNNPTFLLNELIFFQNKLVFFLNDLGSFLKKLVPFLNKLAFFLSQLMIFLNKPVAFGSPHSQCVILLNQFFDFYRFDSRQFLLLLVNSLGDILLIASCLGFYFLQLVQQHIFLFFQIISFLLEMDDFSQSFSLNLSNKLQCIFTEMR